MCQRFKESLFPLTRTGAKQRKKQPLVLIFDLTQSCSNAYHTPDKGGQEKLQQLINKEEALEWKRLGRR